MTDECQNCGAEKTKDQYQACEKCRAAWRRAKRPAGQRELHSACENFFDSWFGPPIGQPEHMERILKRREETKKEFAETLYKFVSLWQKDLVPRQAVTGDAWQPIETAPMDGTDLLLYDEPGMVTYYSVGYYNHSKEGGGWFYGSERLQPTHWMHLPLPPEGCSNV